MAGSLYEVERDVDLCRHCPRHRVRKCPVPGDGLENAPIFLVGEAPGWRENQQGKAFIHKSGRKLDEWLQRTGLTRSDLYVTNILKCFGGKDTPFPDDDEVDGPVDRCMPFLRRQLAAVNPLAIIVTGRRAFHHLILKGAVGRSQPFNPWAGKICRRRDLFGETRIGVMWHPAKIVRQWSPLDEQQCLKVLRRIQEYVQARRAGESAPVGELHDLRPSGTVVYQQRMRLFGAE